MGNLAEELIGRHCDHCGVYITEMTDREWAGSHRYCSPHCEEECTGVTAEWEDLDHEHDEGATE